jgi:hypothetical protein
MNSIHWILFVLLCTQWNKIEYFMIILSYFVYDLKKPKRLIIVRSTENSYIGIQHWHNT